jgi:hypothetical protein
MGPLVHRAPPSGTYETVTPAPLPLRYSILSDMRAKVVVSAAATLVLVSAGVVMGLGNLLQQCTYEFSPTTLCGLGICDAPMTCSLWAPALYLGPLVGVLAGLGVILLMRRAARRPVRQYGV